MREAVIVSYARTGLAKSGRDFGINLDCVETVRPVDIGLSEDRRWLGVAVNWVELAPSV